MPHASGMISRHTNSLYRNFCPIIIDADHWRWLKILPVFDKRHLFCNFLNGWYFTTFRRKMSFMRLHCTPSNNPNFFYSFATSLEISLRSLNSADLNIPGICLAPYQIVDVKILSFFTANKNFHSSSSVNSRSKPHYSTAISKRNSKSYWTSIPLPGLYSSC